MTAQFSLRLIGLFLALAFLPSPGNAATYIKPDDSTELFKLEKIPLQVDGMRELAKHLVVMARRKHDASPANQRATGQLLALAIRLDPANQDARETNDALKANKHLLPSSEAGINTAKARLRFFNRWLANPDAGKDANQLSNYLSDATKILEAETANQPDLGNWSGIVPAVEKYSVPRHFPMPPKNDRPPNPGGSSGDMNKGGETGHETPPQPPKTDSDFHLKEQTMSAPFALQVYEKYRDPRSGRDLYRPNYFNAIAKVQLQLSPCAPDETARLFIKDIVAKDKDDNPVRNNVGKLLHTLLTSRHSVLPHYRSRVTIANGNYTMSNGLGLAAPLALMLESSIANTPLRNDIHICAMINDEGKLSQPDNFWEMLTAMRASKAGGRLIVSPESAKLMDQVLVYGEPDFFTRWEVFSAINIDDALKVATKHSEPDLAEAEQLFDAIQSLARKTAVTKLAVNHVVRDRLAEIAKRAPNHISAKVLLFQGSGKRPMRLSEEAMAHELNPIVKEMHRALVKKLDVENLRASECKDTHDSTREKLDKLSRIVDRTNDDLYQDALDLSSDFRRLQALVRRLHSSIDSFDDNEGKKARALYHKMVRSCEDLQRRIATAQGFTAPEPLKQE